MITGKISILCVKKVYENKLVDIYVGSHFEF